MIVWAAFTQTPDYTNSRRVLKGIRDSEDAALELLMPDKPEWRTQFKQGGTELQGWYDVVAYDTDTGLQAHPRRYYSASDLKPVDSEARIVYEHGRLLKENEKLRAKLADITEIMGRK